MSFQPSEALAPYWAALDQQRQHPLVYHPSDGRPQLLSRAGFRDDALRGAGLIRRAGLSAGACVMHGFSANHPADLIFRLAATMTGTVPVTVNWDADSLERMVYKIELTKARLLIYDPTFASNHLSDLLAARPGLETLSIDALADEPLPNPDEVCRKEIGLDHAKIVIFTSGTTGQPKGVRHTYRSYRANSNTFASFLQPPPSFSTLLAGPLHHANSSAVADWCLREPGATIHLLPRYRSNYWHLLTELAQGDGGPVIAPMVSRHFDFLESLEERGELPVALEDLKAAGNRVIPLLGSAPVGPTTVKRIARYLGKTPTVRFGSTETCLQVMGIPLHLPEDEIMAAFHRGWAHESGSGYYLGRPHLPWTEVRVVQCIDPDENDFLKPCAPGQAGFLITRGENLMEGYVQNKKATARVLREQGWYTGLGDIGFFLENPRDGEADFYWMSRQSDLLIRGGANYSCEQIATELKTYLTNEGLQGAFDLAVVGKKITSEHEDSCCVMITLPDSQSDTQKSWIRERLLQAQPGALSKSARPDMVQFGPIPRNFKGAIQSTILKDAF